MGSAHEPGAGIGTALVSLSPGAYLGWVASASLLSLLVLGTLLSATLSGVIGMAGGTLLLAIMLFSGLDPWLVVPVHAAVQLVANASRVVAHRHHVRTAAFWVLAGIALPGPLLGLRWLEGLDSTAVRGAMGLMIIMSVWLPKFAFTRLSERGSFAFAGAVGGTIGVIVGAVGPMIAPFFLRPSFSKREVIATKAACQAYLHLLKIAAFSGLYPALLTTRSVPAFDFAHQATLIIPMGAAAIGGTYVGKWLLTRVSERRFVVLYKLVLTVLALRLIGGFLWQGLAGA